MKILVISHLFPRPNDMTYGTFVWQWAKAMEEANHKIVIISPVPKSIFPLNKITKKWNKYSEIPSFFRINNIDVYYPRYWVLPWGLFYQISGKFMVLGAKYPLKQLIKKNKFDLVHSHEILPDGYLGLMIKQSYKLPLVITNHGATLQTIIHKNNQCKLLSKKILANTDKIIVVSKKLKSILNTEFSITKNIYIIPNGINPKYIINKKGGGENRKKKDIKILSVSRLTKEKGIELNILAIEKLIDDYPNIKYYILGDGPEKSYLYRMINRNKLQNNIILLGAKPIEKVMEYMSKIDVFSLPSWVESFGIVYIEAMAHEKPVIACRGEGTEDYIINRYNGFLIKKQDLNELVETLRYCIKNPKKMKIIGKNAKKTIINNYTWSNSVKLTIDVYKKVEKC